MTLSSAPSGCKASGAPNTGQPQAFGTPDAVNGFAADNAILCCLRPSASATHAFGGSGS